MPYMRVVNTKSVSQCCLFCVILLYEVCYALFFFSAPPFDFGGEIFFFFLAFFSRVVCVRTFTLVHMNSTANGTVMRII